MTRLPPRRLPGFVLVSAISTSAAFTIGLAGPELVRNRGVSAVGLGLLTSLYFVSVVVLSSLVARITDAVSPRTGLRVLHGLVTVCFLLMASGSVPGLVLGIIAGGAANAMSNPVSNLLVVVSGTSGRTRASTIGWKQAGTPIGGLVLGLVFPGLAGAAGLRAAFAVCAVVALVSYAHTSRLARTDGRSPPPPPDPGPPGAVRSPAGLRRFTAVMGCANGLLVTYLPLHAVTSLGLSWVAAGLLSAVASLASAVGRVGWTHISELPRVTDRACRNAAAVIGAVSSVGLVVPGLPVPLYVAAAVSCGASVMGWQGMVMATLIRSGQRALGRLTALTMRPYYAGLAVAPMAAGQIAHLRGSATVWLLQAALCLSVISVSRGHRGGPGRSQGTQTLDEP